MKIKKDMIKKKIIFSFIAILAVLVLYQIGSIYIWGKHIAERELSHYAKEVLNLQDKIICEYDWYNDRYLASNNLGFVLDYRRQRNTLHDEDLNQKENEQAREDYTTIIGNMPDNLIFPKNIDIWTEISAENYKIKSQRLYLLGVYNTENLTEQDSFLMPAKITMDVIEQLGENYNFTGIQTIYFDENGMYEIAFPADSFEKLTQEKLSNHTKQIAVEEYPEDYVNWLAANN
ncbi:MAG: hypothetical protein AB7D36_08590 [Oscillospiraceae bacterium]